MVILGIETSCDETSSALVKDGVEIISNYVSSSVEIHKKYGGIIPEKAAREQLKAIIPVLKEALGTSTLALEKKGNQLLTPSAQLPKIDAIAVTDGPGLIGSLLVGVETAKTLSFVLEKPLVPVNHLIAHFYANFLETKSPPKFPFVALIVSGAHTDLLIVKGHGKFSWLGGTRDDAAGEAFDKTGRLLGLGYPGGPAIQKEALGGNPKSFNLPRPLINSPDYDFSFSGLKTAVLREVTSDQFREARRKDLAAATQQAIVDTLVFKTLKAAKEYGVKEIIVGGGVAANQRLREEFKKKSSTPVHFPQLELSIDNAAMVASAAYFNYKPIPWRTLNANPSLYFD
ncbi:MAG: tRNA (adenosine(37)-N6)-threonylcarbamoyltransferase complex transferase subunit TsaD [Candidatus Woykebacteria bacterium RBG_13_40_7b]|uniref:tRNA N6-adenosine threonylcarbamoyltransferase n=1 Tax=Candidatus Woykebacteria bacterium RBG_13_40_7b TaxID=1802594 RepID=A0A1G1WBJ6_9BACT|nr:MAG: tRNA (adenosine(37)-N6)-threonylcarbamoyltransferase complex transferase subunit TsaD [Candidatus Woykebacteria bacterium RBG_13_40_7b]